MYNLLIVEDETVTREGILHSIDWKELGIKEVQTAQNGLAALEKTKHFTPHIILSDIKMPHMNGIEMVSALRKDFPFCKVIFLSGYADKDYLLSAITLKAECFIEKPIEIEAIIDAISHAVTQLNHEQSSSLTSKEPKNNSIIMLRGMLSALFSDNFSLEDFSTKYIPNYFPWEESDIYHVVDIKFFLQQKELDMNLIISEIINFFKEYTPLLPDYFIDSIKKNHAVILFKNNNICNLLQIMNSLQQYLMSNYSLESTIGISHICSNLSQIGATYKTVLSAVEYQYFYYNRHCIFECSAAIKRKEAPLQIFTQNSFNLSGVEHVFQTLSTEKYTNISEIRHQLYEYYTLMMERTLNNQTISWEQFSLLTLNEYIDLIGYGMKAYQILGNNTYDTKIKNAVHYILWNYPKQDLSIQMLSEQVDLSPNYLCSLFKKQTGSTINDFIIKVRMDKSRILLEKTDLKLYDIATRVGLQDPNYFSTLFKHEYGMTPSAYRRTLNP